ncbi:hypothetical protein B296_00039724, partial [Ensete ventricosum]
NMLEVDCPCVTPEIVLKASGHVDKFTDLMVKDEKTGSCYRADHLLKDYCKAKLEKDLTLSAEKAAELKHILAVLDDLSADEVGAKIKEYGIAAPDTENPLSDPYPFNLMFQTSIGPSGLSPGYMRPETAQGIFVNFKDLYYYNGNKLPFAAAQIGQAFRNEVCLLILFSLDSCCFFGVQISPRQGLLRVREFTLAEIEHFVDPEAKTHPKFVDVSNLEFLMFPRKEQMAGESAKPMILGEAVSKEKSGVALVAHEKFSESREVEKFDDVAKIIARSLTAAGISHIIDITGTSIGKRYARTDEIGVPFAITVDSTSSVTIRERDSKEQIRVSIDEVAKVVKEVTDGQSTWADILWRYPAHAASLADEE